jgi:hypothetical protein
MPNDDREFQDRFAELREHDAERAPGFAQVYAGARQRRPAQRRALPFAIGAAAAAAVLTVWIVQARRDVAPAAIAATAPSISSWQAPTDVLLKPSGADVLGPMPALGASMLDAMIPTMNLRGD